MTFSNAIILTAGVSLNAFDYPPHSGTNVAVALGQRRRSRRRLVVNEPGNRVQMPPATLDAGVRRADGVLERRLPAVAVRSLADEPLRKVLQGTADPDGRRAADWNTARQT